MNQQIYFDWILPFDVNVCPFLSDGYLRSPVFYLNECRKPGYCLKLNLREVGEEIEFTRLVLCRTDEDGFINGEFECDISKQVWEYTDLYFYQIPKEYAFNLFHEGSFTATLEEIDQTSFRLRCVFRPDSGNEDEDDLGDLSRSFAMILKECTFFDYTFYSADRRQYRAHKAILEVRCSKLVEGSTTNSNQYVGRISDGAIQVLFHYLYSGKLNTDQIPEDLSILLKELDLLNMYRLLSRFPCKTTATTVVRKHFLDFIWVIDNFIDSRGEHCYTVTEGDPFTWLKIIHSVKKFKTKRRREFMIHRIHNRSKIFLRCVLSAYHRNGIKKLVELDHFFENEKDWVNLYTFHIDYFLQEWSEYLENGSMKLRFEIAISNGEHATQITAVDYFPQSSVPSKRNLHELGQNLKKLCKDPKYDDVILNTKNGVIRAHKAILSARSEVFNRMFTHDTLERQTSEVNITDIEKSTMQSMLLYMYSGETEPIDYTNVFDLYYAVDKYAVLMLKKKCTRYLMSVLNFTNITDILIFADMHSDQELKEYVFDFTCKNSGEALSSKSWIDFIEEHPEFSFEAFREGLKFLDELS